MIITLRRRRWLRRHSLALEALALAVAFVTIGGAVGCFVMWANLR